MSTDRELRRKLNLEGAISDCRGNVDLLELAIDDCLKQSAWDLFHRKPMPNYELLLLTSAQVRALNQACANLSESAWAAHRAFYGPDDPDQVAAEPT
jgi:hypothetical protein